MRLIFTLCIVFTWNLLTSQVSMSTEEMYAPDRVIIKLKSNYLRAQNLLINKLTSLLPISNGIASSKNIKSKKSNLDAFQIINFKEQIDVKWIVNQLNQLDYIEYAEPDYIGYAGGAMMETTPNDEFFSRQWSLNNEGNFDLSFATHDADIDMIEAWEIEQGDSSIVVAFLDSGLKLDHPEFDNRIWTNYSEVPSNFIDEDENGYEDDRLGWDFVNEDDDPSDDHGHGTNVISIFGANAYNLTGFAGIDWNSKIMVLKVINERSQGLYSHWAEALYYAVDHGADMVNMSLGGANFSRSLQDAIRYANEAGCTLLACSMNTNSDWVFYPAGYPEVIAVGSTNSDDERTEPFFWDRYSGSNYGDHLDVVAPGHYIFGNSHRSNTNFESYWGGTSQAVPHVTGVCALLLAQDSSRSPEDLRLIIRESADDLVGSATEDKSGFDVYFGFGRLNAFNALSQNTTSNEKVKLRENVKIFPNPVSANEEVLNIEFGSEFIFQPDVNFKLTNVYGAVVQKGSLQHEHSKLRIPTEHLWPGVYLLTIDQNNQLIYSQKIFTF